MSYRAKLYIYFVLVICSITAGSVTFIYYQNKIFLHKELQSNVLSIAATIASLIPVDELDAIQTPQDTEMSPFIHLKKILVDARNINRRKDIYVLYVYLLRVDSDDSQNIRFIIDSTTDPKAFALPGAKYAGSEELLAHFGEYFVPKDFVRDKWGFYLSAYAPVYDSKGVLVAYLGVNIRAKDVVAKLHNLLIWGIVAFVVGAMFSLAFAYLIAKVITHNLAILKNDLHHIEKGDFDHKCVIDTKDEFHDLAEAINQMAQGLKEREKIKVNFARYVSKQVLEKILASKEEVHLEGERKYITVMFSDIPKFSQLAQMISPEEVVALLNEYFSKMIDQVMHFDGTIDKFIGEGIMVEFGAPLSDEKQEEKAVQAAISMHRALDDLCNSWRIKNKPSFAMCIGIHSGMAIIGNMGSSKRMEYTAIGDTVNIAARLVVLSKEKKCPILISESVCKKIEGLYQVKEIGEVELYGRVQRIKVFSIDPKQKEM